MPTTREEKPVKPRSRGRKADQKAAKARAQVASDGLGAEAEPVGAMIAAAIEAAAAEVPQAEMAPTEMAQAEVALCDAAPVAALMEKAPDAALSGEVLSPEVRKPAGQAASVSAIALSYGDYTRKSWAAGRFLVERLIAVRSFEEAIEVQNEFARQAYADFIAQSQRVCVLYGEWAQRSFARYQKLASAWTCPER